MSFHHIGLPNVSGPVSRKDGLKYKRRNASPVISVRGTAISGLTCEDIRAINILDGMHKARNIKSDWSIIYYNKEKKLLVTMSRWVVYEDEPALLLSFDESTDLCEIQKLIRNDKTYQGKITHSLYDDPEVVPYSAITSPRGDFSVAQYFDDIFVINDGDEDYEPSEESDSENSSFSLEEECNSAADSPRSEQDVQDVENTQ